MSVDNFNKIHSMVHLSTGRAGITSNLATISYLPEQKRLSINNFVPERKELKFQKDRRVIKNTAQNMMDETMEKKWKNCRKGTEFTLMSCSKDKPIHRRRNSGEFRKLKQTTMMNSIDIMTRSVDDIGVVKNRRKVEQDVYKKDPILMNTHNPQKEIRTQFTETWKQPRRQRDHGERTEKLMAWNTSRKESGYTEMYKRKKLNKN